MEEDLENA